MSPRNPEIVVKSCDPQRTRRGWTTATSPVRAACCDVNRRGSPRACSGSRPSFQGRQAPVVFYAMTCSSGEEAPRGIDFLLDDHRLNVAISRAQCRAVLVHSRRLLDADCRTLHAMELLDGVCSFVEFARGAADQGDVARAS